MANRITIDVEARYVDHVSSGMNSASKSADKLNKSVKEANKELDKASKKNVKPKLGADDNAFTRKIRDAQKKADKLGKTKVSATLGAIDKASTKIGQVTGAAKAFGSKVFKGSLSMADKASHVIGSVTGAARSFAGKTFSAAVKIVDYATTPLRKIKDALFNIKTLIATITMGLAAKQFILNPINLADQYSGAKIGFSTLLGESEGQAMMNEIDAFAKATPFKTSNTISSIQKMMAYGWDASRVIEDMKVIGDAAAATGKGDQGLESIVYALSEIRSKGKLSTQELNQLASAGIKAKAYLAEGLGYGSSDAGMAKLAKDLEGGAIGANQAIELILEGMKEFDGMMDRTANETVEGLKSQLEDVFEINIARKWGQGLQDGAKQGLGSIVELLNSSEKALENFGNMLYDLGKAVSNFAADKLDKIVSTIKEITATDTFKNASLGEKMKMLWKGVVTDPLSEWWDNGGKEKTAETAGKIGKSIGEFFKNSLLGLFGVTDLLKEDGLGESGGMSVAQSFAKGFAEGFDASVVTDKLIEAVKNVWGALPTWAKALIVSYGAGKAVSGIGNVVGGIGNIVGGIKSFAPLLGSTGNAMMQGTGLLNMFASAGYGLTGGAAGSALSGGTAALIGGGAIAGGIAAGTSAIKGGYDLYKSYKAYKAGDKTEAKARGASGGSALAGVATGAAIGSIFGPAGTLIGAGIGGVAGWWAGSKWAKSIRADAEAAKYETEAMKEAVKDTEKSAEELAMEFERAVNTNIADHFGDIELTMEEIQSIAKRIVLGDKVNDMNAFVKASETAKTSMQGMKTAAESLDRLNWKVGLGLNLDETEIEEYRASIDNYISSAKKYVEDKHYEFTAAVTLLMDVSEGDGKTILETGNTFYAQLKEQIDGLSKELSSTVEIALEDGVITLDEQAEIVNLQNQIAEITKKLSEAETEAGFEAIKIKFGEAHISEESFDQLQDELQKQMDESEATYDNALKVGLTNLQLQYNEGLIDESEYKRLKGVLEESFNSQMESLEVKVQQVQIDIIGEAYEDVLGEDAAAKLSSAIEQSLKEGISPAEWTTDDVRRFLGIDSLSEESAAAIAALLSNMEFTINPSVTVKPTYEEPEPWQPKSENTTQDTCIKINPAYEDPQPWQPPLYNTTQNANIGINPTYNLMNTWTPPSMDRTIFPTIWVKPTYKNSGEEEGNNANGSIVQSKTLSWVGEEGPEAIIPLVPGRRARGLALWAEAGKRLGVQYHAEGGIVGGDSSPIKPFEGEIQTGTGEQKIEVNMGGVTIEIKTDGNKSIADSIEEQEEEIAKKVAEIFKKTFRAQFANIPVRGGA